jgi:hypothetical protein
MDEVKHGAPKRPLPDYFYRLSSGLQSCYLKSESIERFEGFAPSAAAAARLQELMYALDRGALRPVQESAAALMSELCRAFGVPSIRVVVRGVRPHNARGELHGLFSMTKPPAIMLWMRTAKRHDIVKPKTFVRTLLHELCHYLDYSLLKLEDSFHTMGFFKRESFLVRSLAGVSGSALRGRAG